MPSTHSAAIMYYGVYICMACAILPVHESLPQVSLMRWLPPMVILPWASGVACSRIWLDHHSVAQVAVGSAYGIIFAGGWFLCRLGPVFDAFSGWMRAVLPQIALN